MIVVNVKHSMRRLIEQVRAGIPDDALLEEIKRITTTKWSSIGRQVLETYGPERDPNVKALYEHGGTDLEDFILGVNGDQIVSVYKIVGWHRSQDEDRKVVFDVSPARCEMAAVIGQPVPGGPWKRGEARPVRYVDTGTFVAGLTEVDDADDDAVNRRIVEVIRGLAAPAPSRSPLEGVEIEPDPRGGIRVTVPMGTKVTVVQHSQ